MTDIVERLRWSISADTPARYPDIVTEAIIEIERLRAALTFIADKDKSPMYAVNEEAGTSKQIGWAHGTVGQIALRALTLRSG